MADPCTCSASAGLSAAAAVEGTDKVGVDPGADVLGVGAIAGIAGMNATARVDAPAIRSSYSAARASAQAGQTHWGNQGIQRKNVPAGQVVPQR